MSDILTRRRRPDEAPAMDVSQISHRGAAIMARIDRRDTDQCWPWTGYIRNKGGYGWYTLDGRPFGAHRLAYVLANGYIGPNLTVDHLCRNRICCNPAHLEAVTMTENSRRKPSQSTGFCRKGHALKSMVNGKLYCPTCTTQRTRQYYSQTKEPCQFCGKMLGRAYMPSHLERLHGLTKTQPGPRDLAEAGTGPLAPIDSTDRNQL